MSLNLAKYAERKKIEAHRRENESNHDVQQVDEDGYVLIECCTESVELVSGQARELIHI